MATAISKTHSALAGEAPPEASSEVSVTAFQKSLREPKDLTLQLPSPEQDFYHAESLKKSLMGRFAKATKVITRHFSDLANTTDDVDINNLDILWSLAEKLTPEALYPPEEPGLTPPLYAFAPGALKSINNAVILLLKHLRALENPEPERVEAAVLLTICLLQSQLHAADTFYLNHEHYSFYLETFSTPPVLEIMHRDWPAHVRLCELMLDTLHYLMNQSASDQWFSDENSALVRRLQAFERMAGNDVRSQKSRGEQYLREFKLHTYLKEFSSAFLRLHQAELVGNYEAFFDLALVNLGLFSTAWKYINIDSALKFLDQAIHTAQPSEEDDRLLLLEEDKIRQYADEPFLGTEDQHSVVAASVYVTCLKRYIGIDCRKDREICVHLLSSLKYSFPNVQQKMLYIFGILEHSTDRLPKCTHLHSFDCAWLTARVHEQKGRLYDALKLYRKAADESSFMAGWAPVRVAVQLKLWDVALEYGEKLLKSWPDGYDEGDKELLTDTITNLTELVLAKRKREADPDSTLKWITGETSEPGNTGKKKRKGKKKNTAAGSAGQRSKGVAQAASETTAAPTAASKSLPAPDTQKVRRSIQTYPVEESIRQVYRTNRQLASIAITNRQYAEAKKLIDLLPDTKNPVYRARKSQAMAWLKLRQSADASYLKAQAGSSASAQKTIQIHMREDVERLVIDALATLLELDKHELQQLYTDPDSVFETRQLSPEVQCAAASLLSVLGHCYLDIFHTYPGHDYLRKKKKRCFDCADKINPWRLAVKAGNTLSEEALAAMNF